MPCPQQTWLRELDFEKMFLFQKPTFLYNLCNLWPFSGTACGSMKEGRNVQIFTRKLLTYFQLPIETAVGT